MHTFTPVYKWKWTDAFHRVWTPAFIGSLLFLISSALSGCGTNTSSATNSQTPATSTLPSTSLQVNSAPVMFGASASLSWATSAANQTEVEGEDVYSTRASGSQAIAPQHTTMYFLSALNSSGVTAQTLTVAVQVPAAQQGVAHQAWWSGLAAVTSQAGCGNSSVTQQPGEGLQDALSAAEAAGANCLVLQPGSEEAAATYYVGLATTMHGVRIRYISDVPDVPYPNPVAAVDQEKSE